MKKIIRPTSCGPGTLASLLIKSCHRNANFWTIFLIVFLSTSLSTVRASAEERNKNFDMQTLCKHPTFLQSVYRKIEGAVIVSKNERNLDCVVTFQTHSILQRFMLRFDMLQIDCNDHLYVYDGAHATTGAHKYDLSCRNTKQMVGSIFTLTNYITLKYVTDAWGTDTNGFKLIVTAIRDPKHACHTFRCSTREFCIHSLLTCDGVNHCGDNSDEALCQNSNSGSLFGMESTWIVLIAISCLLAFGAGAIGMTICLCRRSSYSNDHHIQLNQAIDTNGSTKYMQTFYHRPTTTTTTLSGNLHRPAAIVGYLRKIHRTLLMARVRPIYFLVNC